VKYNKECIEREIKSKLSNRISIKNLLNEEEGAESQNESENQNLREKKILRNNFSNSFNQIYLVQNPIANSHFPIQTSFNPPNQQHPSIFSPNLFNQIPQTNPLDSSFFEFIESVNSDPLRNFNNLEKNNQNFNFEEKIFHLENENEKLKKQIKEMKQKASQINYSRFLHSPFQEDALFYFVSHPKSAEGQFSLRNGKIEQISNKMQIFFGRDLSSFLNSNTSQFFVKLTPSIIQKRAEVKNKKTKKK
jgi:hypothetical protein